MQEEQEQQVLLMKFAKIPEFFHMPLINGNYWPNWVHGSTPDDVRKDEEGLQIVRNIGRNMAWILKCIQVGKKMELNIHSRKIQLRLISSVNKNCYKIFI